MSKHVELPELAVGYMDQGMGHGHYAVIDAETKKLLDVKGPNKDRIELIVRACNNHKVLLKACENAVRQMQDKPVNAQGEWEQGLNCGLEDMDITDRYTACRYGYDKALAKVQEWIIAEIEDAIEQANKEI